MAGQTRHFYYTKGLIRKFFCYHKKIVIFFLVLIFF